MNDIWNVMFECIWNVMSDDDFLLLYKRFSYSKKGGSGSEEKECYGW